MFGGGISNLMTAMVSAVAMLFSAFSFYESSVKKANLQIHKPVNFYMFREDFRDVLAIPISISNNGAQRGTILSFDLKVTNLQTKETQTFRNLYFGENPKTDKKLFSPITVQGRETATNTVMFHAVNVGTFSEKTGQVTVPLRLTLSMRTDGGAYFLGDAKTEPVTFDMTAKFFNSLRDMERGVPTIFHNKDWYAKESK
ncbi:MAG: hypothetical protein ACRBBN_19655 [Methyloligellaceae bacterium]